MVYYMDIMVVSGIWMVVVVLVCVKVDDDGSIPSVGLCNKSTPLYSLK